MLHHYSETVDGQADDVDEAVITSGSAPASDWHSDVFLIWWNLILPLNKLFRDYFILK